MAQYKQKHDTVYNITATKVNHRSDFDSPNLPHTSTSRPRYGVSIKILALTGWNCTLFFMWWGYGKVSRVTGPLWAEFTQDQRRGLLVFPWFKHILLTIGEQTISTTFPIWRFFAILENICKPILLVKLYKHGMTGRWGFRACSKRTVINLSYGKYRNGQLVWMMDQQQSVIVLFKTILTYQDYVIMDS